MSVSTPVELPPRYRDPRHLANGGMAAVYAAEDVVLGRRVAVKVLAAHFAEDPVAVRRFQREARAAAQVSQHPSVVTIYDVGEHEGRPFIVMELRDGGSLAQVLRSGVPARAEALRWVTETAAALDAAHAAGIVHRDVKPGNLLLDAQRRVAVADFGIARLAYESAVTLTGQVLGTVAYVAPEQASGAGATAASDRYALAVVAFELLTGQRPFPGGGSPAAQARQHVSADPTPASALDPDLPRAVDGVLARGLAKDPAARWPSCAELADALTHAAGAPAEDPTEPTQALPAPTQPMTPTPPRPTRLPAEPGVSVRRARSARWLPVALVAVLLALGAAIAAASGGGQTLRADRSAANVPAPPAPAPPSAAPAPAQPAGQSASALNDQGFALMSAGRYGEAIAPLQQAVQLCGDSRETVCAYALYNLGRSLRLAGRPSEAIPVLERRLGYGNQTGVVQAELDAARAAAGQAPSGAGQDQTARGQGQGKGKGKGQGKDHGKGRESGGTGGGD
jgi:serine/threonine-protein kinase